MRVGRAPIIPSERTPNATRSFTRCTKRARARMKLPMNRKMVVLANGRKVSPAGATCRKMASAGPISAVTASGTASVTQNTMTRAMTAASRWPSGVSDSKGHARTSRNASGPTTRPIFRRFSSNAASAADLAGRGSLGAAPAVDGGAQMS